MRLRLGLCACLAALHLGPASARATPMFIGLGDLAGGSFSSVATDISADGSVVVGTGMSQTPAGTSRSEAFRWTAASGMVGLGDLPGGSAVSLASGVSSDGSVVVGSSGSTSGFEGYRWTAASGMVGIGDLPGGNFTSLPQATSADGSVIVGYSQPTNFDQLAFRWTAATGIQALSPSASFSWATDVSPDGSIIVGNNGYWTADGVKHPLSPLPFASAAVTADGTTIAGNVFTTAAVWTASTGTILLGRGDVFDISLDGSTIVGQSDLRSGTREAVLWFDGQLIPLAALLESYGLDLGGWTLLSARAVSSDGLTLVGEGIDPGGQTQAWLAVINANPTPPVPEPGVAWLLASGLVALAIRRVGSSRR